MITSDISVQFLSDHPHLIPAVATMRWKEWGKPPECEDLDWWIEVIAAEAGNANLPVTWVAIDGRAQAVGAVGLAEFDLQECHDRSPWLIGMIVSQQQRGAGIGGMLVQTLKTWALDRKIPEVWVATVGRGVDFYLKHGWHSHEVLEESSGESSILRFVAEPGDAEKY